MQKRRIDAVRIEVETGRVQLLRDVPEAVADRHVLVKLVAHDPTQDARVIPFLRDDRRPFAVVGVQRGFRIRARRHFRLPAGARPRNVRRVDDGELDGGDDADLVARLVIFGRQDRAVVAHMVEAVGFDHPQLSEMKFLVGRHRHLHRINVVVAIAAQHDPLAVQEDAVAADRKLPHAEAAGDRVEDLRPLEQAEPGRVKRRRIGRPQVRAGDGNLDADGLPRSERGIQIDVGIGHAFAALIEHLNPCAVRQPGLAAQRRADRATAAGHIGLDKQVGQPSVGPSLQQHMAPDSAPGHVHIIGQRRSAEHRVDCPALLGIDLDRDRHGLTWSRVLRDLVFLYRQVADMFAQIVVVDPDFRAAADPGDRDENALPRPGAWNLDCPFVPALADEVVTDFVGFRAVSLVVPDAGHADGAVGRRCVTWQRHGGQLRAGQIPLLGFAASLGVGGEVPHSVETQHRPAGR